MRFGGSGAGRSCHGSYFSAFCFARPFLYFSHLLIMVLNPSLGEDSWKGTSATPRGRFQQPYARGWGLTLTQAHNCTNGDRNHLHFILYSMIYNNNCYYYCYNINVRCKVYVPDFVAGFLRLYTVLQELFWYMQRSPTCPEFWSRSRVRHIWRRLWPPLSGSCGPHSPSLCNLLQRELT